MLDIKEAKYGAIGVEKDKVDVTPNVKQLISTDKKSISAVVGPTALNIKDPSPGNQKELSVKYVLDDNEYFDTIKDGFTFTAASYEKAPQSWTAFTAAIYTSLWQNMWGAVVLFATVFSVGLAFGLGKYYGNPILWIIVSLLFPYASFWLILAIVIIMRILSPIDIIKPYFT